MVSNLLVAARAYLAHRKSWRKVSHYMQIYRTKFKLIFSLKLQNTFLQAMTE